MGRFMGFLFILAALAGCGDDEEWAEAERESAEAEKEFIENYFTAWEESLEYQNFSMVEPYFVINTHGYHTERRHHQQLVSSRKMEEIGTVNEITPQENQYGDERMKVEAEFSIQERGEISSETRTRYFYLMQDNDDWKVDAIGREDS
ncbi:TcaA NTF2-like domain-containing protein [Alkalicoccus saliphilus]|uniref:TcaA protein NTF2-like domain-containing protein n=1 Tax=Alkalicoccus saliphilus TaxID=200989 RepID=A0A2T4UA57_9BACI|nr:hypothetical protein [Alkalicoccus saliphilus]PTL40270.1 hypothetical protein C6Y45_02505 [Alkalicoccus saliphilus]